MIVVACCGCEAIDDFSRFHIAVQDDGSVSDLVLSACAPICGPQHDEDCCAALPIPGGTFDRSSDPTYPATISPFRLDRFEVTVGRFRAFVLAGMATQENPPTTGSGAHPKIPGSGWAAAWSASLAANSAALAVALKCDPKNQTWTDVAGANDDKPINCVTWYEAMAFCIRDGGRLPTEAEWNFVAAGGSDQRLYPWSTGSSDSTIDLSYAVYDGALIADVGSKSPKGDGKWGHADLAGNVWEWVFDWYASTYTNPCTDCADVNMTTARVLLGGNLQGSAAVLLTTSRPNVAPDHRDNSSGFRCAR